MVNGVEVEKCKQKGQLIGKVIKMKNDVLIEKLLGC